jgi:anti-anti-sigma regulatory factor
MPTKPDPTPETSTPTLAVDRWCIDGALTIGTIADWYGRFSERAAAATDLELDLTGVTAVDVFGLQFLHSARRGALEGGRNLRLTAIPPLVQAMAASVGFSLNP